MSIARLILAGMLFLAVGFPCAAPALAGSPQTTTPGTPADKKGIEAARDVWRTAMITRDEMIWRRILSDDLQYAHSVGELENKEQTIQKALASKVSYTQIDFIDSKISVFGRTAIVTGKEVYHTAGKDQTDTVLALTVWEKGKLGWQLMAKLQKRSP